MKITRIELCHPVNRPGKRDDNYKELPPVIGPVQHMGQWRLELKQLGGIAGVNAQCPDGEIFIPSTNIKSIDHT